MSSENARRIVHRGACTYMYSIHKLSDTCPSFARPHLTIICACSYLLVPEFDCSTTEHGAVARYPNFGVSGWGQLAILQTSTVLIAQTILHVHPFRVVKLPLQHTHFWCFLVRSSTPAGPPYQPHYTVLEFVIAVYNVSHVELFLACSTSLEETLS
jgi:hypothetical protein